MITKGRLWDVKTIDDDETVLIRGFAAPTVIVTCGNDSQRVLGSVDRQNAEFPESMDDDILVQSTPDTLVTVQQVDDRVVATDLLAEEELWDQAKPLEDLYIYTTSKYAILVSNDRSHNAFSVVDLSIFPLAKNIPTRLPGVTGRLAAQARKTSELPTAHCAHPAFAKFRVFNGVSPFF